MNHITPNPQPVLLARDLSPRLLDLLAITLRQLQTTPTPDHLAPEPTPTLQTRSKHPGHHRFEAWEAHDTSLNRTVLLQCVPATDPSLAAAEALIQEATLRARLSHPHIASIHTLGALDDGRPFFTSDLIQGKPMDLAINEVHKLSTRTQSWTRTRDGWSLRRLVEAIAQLCEAAAAMHAQGVVHGDITTHNAIIDDRQHVWLSGFAHAHAPDTPQALIEAQRHDLNALGTALVACIAGIDASKTPRDLLEALPLAIDPDLLAIAQQTLDPTHPTAPKSASALASALRLWLEGEPRRARAQALFDEAKQAQRLADQHHHNAQRLSADAEAQLADLPPYCDATLREPWWDQLKRAQQQAHDCATLTQRSEQLLAVSLTHDPYLHDARTALIAYHQGRFDDAERYREHHAQHEARLKLEHHVQALPNTHPERVRMEGYLEGEGAVTVVTEPSGAEVEIYRYEERHRRLVEVHVKTVGPTPIVELPLPMGSYLLVLRKDGFAPTRYPVFIERLTHWHGVPPGDTEPLPIPLIPQHHLPPDALYIPPGPFWAGGFSRTPHSFIKQAYRLWVDGFVIQRAPVTCAEYVSFLNDVLEHQGDREALAYAPVYPQGTSMMPVFQRDPTTGAFLAQLNHDYGAFEEGSSIHLDGIIASNLPMVDVTWSQAMAYCAWRSTRDGVSWRLPTSPEWEKAARGVDGRLYPWGRHPDIALCHARGSRPGFEGNVPTDTYPHDMSPYGLLGAAGGVRNWCLEYASKPLIASERLNIAPALATLSEDASDRVVRGGSSMYDLRTRPLGHSGTTNAMTGWADLGFRLMTTDLFGTVSHP